MELKRYVMLSNKMILDSFKKDFTMTLDKELVIIYGEIYEMKDFMKGVLKTSDNILDLVEVGDLVECTYHHESSDNGEWIEKPLYYIKGISDIYFHLPVFSLEKTHKYITALFKRQPNGDYKRYEVKA